MAMVEEMEQYYEILRKSYAAQAEYIRDMRRLKHDMQAHMIVLQYYLDTGKYEEAKAYLKEMRENQELVKRAQVETGNPMINAIITERWEQSKAAIHVSCEGSLPENMQVSEYDLCTIFSNLFSNAVEACEKLAYREKEIALEIRQQKEGCIVEMKNPVEWHIDEQLLGCGSTKEEKEAHGFGLSNVMEAVEKNKGRLEFLMEDDSFLVRIFFRV